MAHFQVVRVVVQVQIEDRLLEEFDVVFSCSLRMRELLGDGAGGSRRTPGAAPKSGFCLPLVEATPSSRKQTILRADLSSTQQEQSKELIRSCKKSNAEKLTI